MNLAGRGLLFLFGAFWIAAATSLIILAWNSDEMIDVDVKDFTFQAFVEVGDAERWGMTLVVGALALVGVAALLIAVLPGRTRVGRGVLRLRQSDGGVVEVSNEALEGLLVDELEQLSEVRNASAAIRVRSGAISTDLDLVVAPGARIADVTSVVGARLTEVFRDQVGVTNVHRPLVRIAYDAGVAGASPPGAGPVSAPAPLPPPPQPPSVEGNDD